MTPKPCACAPGCAGTPEDDNFLCPPCWLLWSASHAARRALYAPDTAAAERQLADWARTRSAELVQDRLKAKGAQP